MRTYKKPTEKVIFMLALAALFISTAAFSSGTDKDTQDKTILKAREAVESASPYDWKTLAVHAEKCMTNKINLKEAAEWLDRSLEIKKDPYNLRLKGDYYNANNLPDEALEYYIKSMQAGLAQDIHYKDVDTQIKIHVLHKSRI